MRGPLVIALGLVAALVVGTAVWAAPQRSATLEPRERVRGMLVVQGPATRANTALFGIYCQPGSRGKLMKRVAGKGYLDYWVTDAPAVPVLPQEA